MIPVDASWAQVLSTGARPGIPRATTMEQPSPSMSCLAATARSLKPGTVRRTGREPFAVPGARRQLVERLGAHVVAGEHGVDHGDLVHALHCRRAGPSARPPAPATRRGPTRTRGPRRPGRAVRGRRRGAPAPGRPGTLVVVLGTGTEVGKTWVTAALARRVRDAGVVVSARKPAQSFAVDEPPGRRDAAVLGEAVGEAPEAVCPPHRWYPEALAPPMAAEALGRPVPTVAELVAELVWPADVAGTPGTLGLVETAGGVRSPLGAPTPGVRGTRSSWSGASPPTTSYWLPRPSWGRSSRGAPRLGGGGGTRAGGAPDRRPDPLRRGVGPATGAPTAGWPSATGSTSWPCPAPRPPWPAASVSERHRARRRRRGPAAPGQGPAGVTVPWSRHRAVHPVGTTVTVMRRPQRGQ